MVSVEEEILSAASIGITGHIRPDGDCVGSTLGLYNYIRENMPDKTVDIYLDPIEKNFKFLSGASDIRHSANKISNTMFLSYWTAATSDVLRNLHLTIYAMLLRRYVSIIICPQRYC